MILCFPYKNSKKRKKKLPQWGSWQGVALTDKGGTDWRYQETRANSYAPGGGSRFTLRGDFLAAL